MSKGTKEIEKDVDAINAEYRAECDRQLEEWVKGNNIHNDKPAISKVVNPDGVVVGYHEVGGGECCPDFSCCNHDTSTHWPPEVRQKFYDAHKTGNKSVCNQMLMMALGSLIATTNTKVHITGQEDNDTRH